MVKYDPVFSSIEFSHAYYYLYEKRYYLHFSLGSSMVGNQQDEPRRGDAAAAVGGQEVAALGQRVERGRGLG